MIAELEGYEDQLLSIRQDAPGIVAHLSDEQFNWRPAPNRWSIAECFDHLNVTARAFMPELDRAIADARARGLTGTGPFAYGLLDRLSIRAMEPPPRLRVRTPKVFAPSKGRSSEAVMTEFYGWQDRLGERIRSLDGLDLRRARMRSPAVKWMKYSLGGALAMTLAHERRHLWQARQVRNEMERRKGDAESAI